MTTDLQRYTADAIADDLPRILRSDMTRMTEMLAKYDAIADAATSPELATQLDEARVSMMNTRQALGHAADLLAKPPKEAA